MEEANATFSQKIQSRVQGMRTLNMPNTPKMKK